MKRFWLYCILFFSFFVSGGKQNVFARDFYWESPIPVSSGETRFPRAATNKSDSYIFWQEIDTRSRRIWISCQYLNDEGVWETNSRFAGPVSYTGEVPDLYTAAVSPNGTIAVATVSAEHHVAIYVSNNKGRSFSISHLAKDNNVLVAPRIYATKDNGFRLFSSLGANERFALKTAVSKDGVTWGDLTDFVPAVGMTNAFVPVLAITDVGDAVVFQSHLQIEGRLSYQLYYTYSTDGTNWSVPILVTGRNSLVSSDTRTYNSYNNQQPFLTFHNGELYLAWERSYYAYETASIYLAKLNAAGLVPGSVEVISNRGNSSRAVLFGYDSELAVTWFDTRNGTETVFMAEKEGALWQTRPLSTSRRSNIFVSPVLSDGGERLSFVWQENVSGGSSVYRLDPDLTVEAPKISAISFTEGKRSTAERVRMQVVLPNDSSGVAGFSWLWTKNISEEPPEYIMNSYGDTNISVSALDDGKWYLKVRAKDNAGNWSPSGVITYHRDLTPPLAPIISEPRKDRFGFLRSNTFDMGWRPNPSDDDVEGYTWSLEYIAPLDSRVEERSRHPILISDARVNSLVASVLAENRNAERNVARPPATMLSTDRTTSYDNRRNGLYVFSVAAIDTVGNIGPAATIRLLMNKYVPSTYITTADVSIGTFGDVVATITGGGFTYDGTVSEIYVDRDGEAPYDLTLSLENGDYEINSDNSIVGISFGTELVRGTYKIGLLHPDRGLYISEPMFTIEENGTVKIEKRYDFVPAWTTNESVGRWRVQVGDILLWSLFALALVGMIFAMRGIIQTARVTFEARAEAHALVIGAVMPQERKKKAVALSRKGASLRIKLVAYTVGLVVAIVTLVAVPLGFNMTRTQERTLSYGLVQRVNVLLEGLSSGVRAYMPTQNVLELSFLPNQSSAMDEAEFVTITGYPADSSNTQLNYVWATDDDNILAKIDTSSMSPGASIAVDPTVVEIASRSAALNAEAVSLGRELAGNIAELNAEGASLALRTDAASVARREEIAEITTQLSTRFDTIMNGLSNSGSGSIPPFNSGELDRDTTEYMFYRPVIYRQGTSQEYVRAVILVKVTTENLIKDVDDARSLILRTAIIIAIIAIAIGAMGSMLLATVIVSPLRKLTAHVTEIGQTRNKEKLAGREIVIKSRDEIGQLGDTVNEMTRDLVKAALDERLLMDGKVVQQTFLPLSTATGGAKETVAQLQEDKIECFGYYEGASGVSGDYFDYKKLDNRWYAIIKCDASGHGVPAALIMTIVATLFRKYFENWSFKRNGTHIDTLITQINDFIESLGLKGKFAAIIVCLFDTETGDVYMCNAGDNVVHIYDAVSRVEKVLLLPETPAAGPLPSFMVDMKGGFKVEKVNIRKGDVLFLYTDGIEEATRKFRDSSYSVVKCMESGLSEGELHKNHKVGEESEQLDPERVQAIIEAVFKKSKYVLEKHHNPISGEQLVFDFTNCDGSIEEAIIALASVEKVFRMYKSPNFTEIDTVRVDKRIDDFLQKHFNRYNYYCSDRQEVAGEQNYCEYAYLREDEQLDDLTLLAVRRK